MPVEASRRRLRAASPERVDDFRVLLDRALQSNRFRQIRELVTTKSGPRAPGENQHPLIAGSTDQQRVPPGVVNDRGARVARRSVEGAIEVLQLVKPFRGGRPGTVAKGRRLQGPEERVGLLDIDRLQRWHSKASPGSRLNHAVPLKRYQRLAYRSPADVERRGKIRLAQLSFQRSLQDALLQYPDQRFPQRRPNEIHRSLTGHAFIVYLYTMCRQSGKCAQVTVVLAILVAPTRGMAQSSIAYGDFGPPRASVVDGHVDPHLHGTWRMTGYGQILSIGRDGWRLFRDGVGFCVDDQGAATEPFGDRYPLFRVDEASGSPAILRHREGTAYVLEAMKVLPGSCTRPTAEKSSRDPAANVHALWRILDRYYPFFELRGVDWRDGYRKATAVVDDVSTDEDLFTLMSTMLSTLRDPHLTLTGWYLGDGRYDTHYYSSRLDVVIETLMKRVNEDPLRSFESRFESWSSLQREGIDEEILGGEARAPGTGSIRYGMAASGIGYTAIRSLDRFVESDDWSEQVSVVDSAFADLFAMMSDDDPLILDLSHNGGGWDYLARAVARQVIRERRQAYTKWVAGAPELSRQTFDLEPASKWRGHLYIVTSDLTMSAAEVIIMSLHDLPYVTLVGQTTRGAFSDRMSMLLPNGWEVQFGNEIYEAPDGEVYEGRGFEPEIPLSIFPPDDLSNGHARAVRELLERIAAPDE